MDEQGKEPARDPGTPTRRGPVTSHQCTVPRPMDRAERDEMEAHVSRLFAEKMHFSFDSLQQPLPRTFFIGFESRQEAEATRLLLDGRVHGRQTVHAIYRDQVRRRSPLRRLRSC